jgi:hypothetical protein
VPKLKPAFAPANFSYRGVDIIGSDSGPISRGGRAPKQLGNIFKQLDCGIAKTSSWVQVLCSEDCKTFFSCKGTNPFLQEVASEFGVDFSLVKPLLLGSFPCTSPTGDFEPMGQSYELAGFSGGRNLLSSLRSSS